MRRILLILIFILGIGSSAFATSWYYVGTTNQNDGCSIYVDNDSVIKNNEYAVVWSKMIYADCYYIARVYVSHNHYMKIMTASKYDLNGKFIDKYTSGRNSIVDISPESLGDTLYHLIW